MDPVNLGGIELSNAVSEKPPVLLLHGLGGTGETLRPVAEALKAQGYHVVAPTLAEADRKRAMSGASLSHVGLHHALSEVSEHAGRLRDQAGGVRPIVCGHSNGSLLALALANEGQVLRVVLLSPVPPPSIGSVVPKWLQRAFFRLSFGRGWRTGAIRFDTERKLDPDPPSPAVAKTLLPDSGRILDEVVDLPPGSRCDPEPPLTCDCMVIAGKADRVVSAGTARKIAERFGAEFHVMKNVGHWLSAEAQNADEIARLIAAKDHVGSSKQTKKGGIV